MTEGHGTLYIIADFLFSIFLIVGLLAGILYLAIFIIELIKGTFGDD